MSNSTSAPRPYPWAALPADIKHVLGAALPDLVEEIIDSVPAEVTEYARPLEGEFGAALRRGVEVALGRLFVELPGRDEPPFAQDERLLYRQLGTGEARTGRSLEALLSAYRLGTRLAFTAMTTAASDAGVSADVLITLGESIFVYFDEISAASVEGFAEEQSRRVGERDRRREALLTMLLAGHGDQRDTRQIAGQAGWKIPARAFVVVVPLDHAEGLPAALGERCLTNVVSGKFVALVPEPPTPQPRARLVRALTGRHAWVGPGRDLARLPESLAVATLAAASHMPELPDGQPRFVADHLSDLIIGSEPTLLQDLARHRLAPLDECRPNQRQRLTETLAAWLRHRGERAPIAEELGVHTQTVGYRVGQLRDLFGEELDDPDIRFELELVLRAQSAAGVTTPPE